MYRLRNNLIILSTLIITFALLTSCQKTTHSVEQNRTLQSVLAQELNSNENLRLYNSDVLVEFDEKRANIGLISDAPDKNGKEISTYFSLASEKNFKKNNFFVEDATVLRGEGRLFLVKENDVSVFLLNSISEKIPNNSNAQEKFSFLVIEEIAQSKYTIEKFSVNTGFGLSAQTIPQDWVDNTKLRRVVKEVKGLEELIFESRKKALNQLDKVETSLWQDDDCDAGGEGSSSCSYTCGQTDCDVDCSAGYYACCNCDTSQDAGANCNCVNEDLQVSP